MVSVSVLVLGMALVASACGEDEHSSGVMTGEDAGGGVGSGGRATGGAVATGGVVTTGGRVELVGGSGGDGGAGSGVAGASGESGGAPAECSTEAGAGAPSLGLGGAGGASNEDIELCADKACETVTECGIARASLVCVGCTASLPGCSCQCYQRFRKCGASCEEFEACVQECIAFAC